MSGGHARQLRDSRPPAAREAGGGAESLVDRAMLDGLAAKLPADAFVEFVRRGIENAERACNRLGTLPAGSEEGAIREAHSLKGTWGSLGLKRISAIAGEIEAAVQGRGGRDRIGRAARGGGGGNPRGAAYDQAAGRPAGRRRLKPV